MRSIIRYRSDSEELSYALLSPKIRIWKSNTLLFKEKGNSEEMSNTLLGPKIRICVSNTLLHRGKEEV
jgi:hypothetical protein